MLLCAITSTTQPAPDKPLAFFRYIIDQRAEDGLRRIQTGPHSGPGIVIYNGDMEDANVAWVMAAAYGAKWSRWHRNADMRREAFRLMDAVADLRANGDWSDSKTRKGNSNAQCFGLHAFACATWWWDQTGDLPAENRKKWISVVRKTADFSMDMMKDLWCMGEYANPEFYYLSGLAVAWKLTGYQRYLDEAKESIRRYEDDLFPLGGMSYIVDTNAQPDYQCMVIRGTAVYYAVTQDPYALDLLRRLAPYYPRTYEPAGLSDQMSPPFLKHNWMSYLIPGAPSIIASLTGDRANARVAEIATQRVAQWIRNERPEWMKGLPTRLFNYHHTTFCVVAERCWQDVQPEPLPGEICERDEDLLGARVRTGDFSAIVTTRRISDTLAACQVTNKDPAVPLDAALGWVYFEHKMGEYTRKPGKGIWIPREWYFMSRPDPTRHTAAGDGLVAVTSASDVYQYYGWQEPRHSSKGAWRYVQTWAVAPSMLFGVHTYEATADGGDALTADFARVRFVFLPAKRQTQIRKAERQLSGQVGNLSFAVHTAQAEGWELNEIDGSGEPPHEIHWNNSFWNDRHLVICRRELPWEQGDRVQFGCAFWRSGAKRATPPLFFTWGESLLGCALRVDGHAQVLIANHGLETRAIRLPGNWRTRKELAVEPQTSAIVHIEAGDRDEGLLAQLRRLPRLVLFDASK